MSRNSLRLCPRRRITSLTSCQQLLSAVTLRIRVAVHQRKTQHRPGEDHRHIITGSFGNPQRLLDLAHDRNHRAASTPYGIPGK